jgi:hypothetical protein
MTEAELSSKVRRAGQMLLYQRHRVPGVKGYELRRSLGKGYMRIIKILRAQLENIGLTIKIMPESDSPVNEDDEEELSSARFFVVLKDPLSLYDASTAGWSIDDLSGLAVVLSTIISRRGKAPRREVERILKEKFPDWKAGMFIERYIRRGYISMDDNNNLILDWRSRGELDLQKLLQYVLGAGISEASPQSDFNKFETQSK